MDGDGDGDVDEVIRLDKEDGDSDGEGGTMNGETIAGEGVDENVDMERGGEAQSLEGGGGSGRVGNNECSTMATDRDTHTSDSGSRHLIIPSSSLETKKEASPPPPVTATSAITTTATSTAANDMATSSHNNVAYNTTTTPMSGSGGYTLAALRRGVLDQNGDMAYYDTSFVEDPWKGLR